MKIIYLIKEKLIINPEKKLKKKDNQHKIISPKVEFQLIINKKFK